LPPDIPNYPAGLPRWRARPARTSATEETSCSIPVTTTTTSPAVLPSRASSRSGRRCHQSAHCGRLLMKRCARSKGSAPRVSHSPDPTALTIRRTVDLPVPLAPVRIVGPSLARLMSWANRPSPTRPRTTIFSSRPNDSSSAAHRRSPGSVLKRPAPGLRDWAWDTRVGPRLSSTSQEVQPPRGIVGADDSSSSLYGPGSFI
jgi:hypothetical protein